jgi:hypothetical protein
MHVNLILGQPLPNGRKTVRCDECTADAVVEILCQRKVLTLGRWHMSELANWLDEAVKREELPF